MAEDDRAPPSGLKSASTPRGVSAPMGSAVTARHVEGAVAGKRFLRGNSGGSGDDGGGDGGGGGSGGDGGSGGGGGGGNDGGGGDGGDGDGDGDGDSSGGRGDEVDNGNIEGEQWGIKEHVDGVTGVTRF
ncbi:glycine-rich cell wall structural protein 1.0-like [Pogonomyrmex barbatus]|uniref:Glycine-rich cell wall structural protein 1.0-like n=1 Tax=Pogonomyrmex barbatus TaxID=144034 RepID=A0A6I9XLD2_9HYME|nr:glycine-rich cell wall structural protein 1.0-like [Pogonomyrmex barbatus]